MRHIISRLLFFAVILQCIICAVGCSGETSTDTPNIVTDTDTSAELTDETVTTSAIEAKDFEGRIINIISSEAGIQNFPYYEIKADEENGDTMNDAVYRRNIYLEEKFNIELESVLVNHGDVGLITKSITSDEHVYDMVMISPRNAFTLAVNKQLTALDSLPYINKNNEWWCKYINSATSIKNFNYFLTGDMNIETFASADLVYFNKTVQQENNIEDLYTLVENGDFTMDKFKQICSDVTRDINGDGEYGDEDLIGYRGNANSFQMHLFASGKQIIPKDAQDIPYINISDEIVQIMTASIDLLNYKPYIQLPNLEAVGIPTFKNDMTLFLCQSAYISSVMRDMKSDFGLLPLPKYDEKQDTYYSIIHTTWSSTVAVPSTLPTEDYEMMGMIIEEMAYSSRQIIRPAFYDSMLSVKLTRDEESGRVLKYIFENTIVDFAYLMSDYQGFNFDTKTREMTMAGDNNVSSFIASNLTKYQSALDSVIENW